MKIGLRSLLFHVNAFVYTLIIGRREIKEEKGFLKEKSKSRVDE